MHELTHAAYTIKDEYGIGERHIFSTIGEDNLSGEYRKISGNNNNVEAIVNYISSRIEGKNPEEISTYQAETKAIYMLAEKIDEKTIIQAAWNSDEQQFKQLYVEAIGTDIEIGQKSYDNFQNIMEKLIVTREQNISISERDRKNELLLSQMQQILDGKSYELESSKFKNIEKTVAKENTEPINMPKKDNKLSFTQKLATFLGKHDVLMSIPIFRNFAKKHLDLLPPVKNQEENDIPTIDSQKNNFTNQLTDNVVEDKELPPIQTNEQRNLNEKRIGENVR